MTTFSSKTSFFIFLILCLDCLPSNNSYGQLGYINTPSAFTKKEVTFGMSFIRSDPDRRINLNISPADFFDATIFYVDITGKDYPGDFKQSYKDKGFNFKLRLLANNNYALSIGLNDAAGTGIYSSEYIVFSQKHNKLEYSIGLGWGLYNSGITFDNPFKSIRDSFSSRKGFDGYGGEFNANTYFSGEKTALFGGASYKFNDRTKLIIEYDPTIKSDLIGNKVKENISLGIDYSRKNYSLKLSSIGLNNFALQLDISNNFLQFSSSPIKIMTDEINSYSDFQKILEQNQIGLKEINKDENSVEVVVRQNSFQNQYEANYRVHQISKQFFKGKDHIITHHIHGMEVLKTFHKGNEIKNVRNEIYPLDQEKPRAYSVVEQYPIFRNSITPSIRNYFAAREGFLFSGLLLEDSLEIIFKENLIFLGNIKHSIVDNFDELYIPARDTYPNQVRSDNKDYLNQMSDRLVLGRLELNYFNSYERKHFFHVRAGIFEEMYGGYGFDYLLQPEGSFYSLGFELHKVKKRDYKMNFSFQGYENTLLRLNYQITDPKSKYRFKISAGEYLAGDIGYTFEIGRRFDNGIEYSAFFTRTDVTKTQFGEGSFDKGIRFKIPFNLFGNSKSLSNFEWRPLTKDPGALFIKGIELQDQIDRYRVY